MAELNWKTGLISEGPCQLEYKYISHPGKPWMAFLHGFGQDYYAFHAVYPKMEAHCSFLALHLFFHGETSLEGTKPLDPEDWKRLIRSLFQRLEIDNAHWMAYSMGAKFTLLSYQEMPELFSGITLLAPDGVVMNPWYGFATKTMFGRFCTRVCLEYMPAFRFLVIVLGKLKLVRPSLGRFAASQLSTEEDRERVLDVWLRLRKMWPDEQKWRPYFNQHPIPFVLVLGKHDTIMSKSKFRTKRKEWTNIKWLDLEAGHASLVEKFAKEI